MESHGSSQGMLCLRTVLRPLHNCDWPGRYCAPATIGAAGGLRPLFQHLVAGGQADGRGHVHWTGKPHRLTSLVRIDGKAFRLMGKEPADVPALPQTGLEVLPTRTIYTFEGEGVRLTLTFMTAALPDDLMIYSRPVTYLTWRAAGDGREGPRGRCVLRRLGGDCRQRPEQEVYLSVPQPLMISHVLKIGSGTSRSWRRKATICALIGAISMWRRRVQRRIRSASQPTGSMPWTIRRCRTAFGCWCQPGQR